MHFKRKASGDWVFLRIACMQTPETKSRLLLKLFCNMQAFFLFVMDDIFLC